MQLQETMLLAVEVPEAGVRVVRMAGDLDAAAGRRLAGLAEVQLRRVSAEAADARRSAYLLLDLASVRSFSPSGMEALTGVRDAGLARGVRVHLTGLSGRQLQLPGQVINLLHHMRSYPTVECALQNLKAT
jgi:anti-anti-sigma regulatory factor